MISIWTLRKNFGLESNQQSALSVQHQLIRGHWVWLNADC
jgi:hypothetical protein